MHTDEWNIEIVDERGAIPESAIEFRSHVNHKNKERARDKDKVFMWTRERYYVWHVLPKYLNTEFCVWSTNSCVLWRMETHKQNQISTLFSKRIYLVFVPFIHSYWPCMISAFGIYQSILIEIYCCRGVEFVVYVDLASLLNILKEEHRVRERE